MGDAADLALDILESGQSLVWDELTEELVFKDNIELMNSQMHGLIYLEECDLPILLQIIQKYKIDVEDEGDLVYSIMMHFDP